MKPMLCWAAAFGVMAYSAASIVRPQAAERGRYVFERRCAACHDAGPDMPGTDALQAKYHGTVPAPLVQRTDLTADTVKYFVRHGVSIMPFFRKTEISDTQLEDLAAYLSHRGR